MKEYTVTIMREIEGKVKIKAENEDEAERLAYFCDFDDVNWEDSTENWTVMEVKE